MNRFNVARSHPTRWKQRENPSFRGWAREVATYVERVPVCKYATSLTVTYDGSPVHVVLVLRVHRARESVARNWKLPRNFVYESARCRIFAETRSSTYGRLIMRICIEFKLKILEWPDKWNGKSFENSILGNSRIHFVNRLEKFKE